MTFALIGEITNGNASAALITFAFAATIPSTAVGHCLLLIFCKAFKPFQFEKPQFEEHLNSGDLNANSNKSICWQIARGIAFS